MSEESWPVAVAVILACATEEQIEAVWPHAMATAGDDANAKQALLETKRYRLAAIRNRADASVPRSKNWGWEEKE